MKTRVTQASLRRLEKLEQKKVTRQRGGVLVVPETMKSVDEWQAIAAPMQAKLIEDVRK